MAPMPDDYDDQPPEEGSHYDILERLGRLETKIEKLMDMMNKVSGQKIKNWRPTGWDKP